jgi:endo-1,4-beta-xylanase
VTPVTFWGITDRDSWLNNWPVRLEAEPTIHYCLIDYKPKPALDPVIEAANQ